MGFSLDFKELKNFERVVGKVGNDFDKFLKQTLLKSAQMVIAKTKRRTPVDTGALRRSWILGDVKGFGTFMYVEILNGMNYATEVEYGRRRMKEGVEVGWINGHFMLKISIDEVKRRIPAEYANDLRRYCEMKGLRYD